MKQWVQNLFKEKKKKHGDEGKLFPNQKQQKQNGGVKMKWVFGTQKEKKTKKRNQGDVLEALSSHFPLSAGIF